MKCSICGQPIRVIPSNSKLKDIYNKAVLILGRCCMPCALAYKNSGGVRFNDARKQAWVEADKLSEEERGNITKERMIKKGLIPSDISDEELLLFLKDFDKDKQMEKVTKE